MIVTNFIGTNINKYQCNGVAKFFLNYVFERWQKTALLVFSALAYVLAKNQMCCLCGWLFLFKC